MVFIEGDCPLCAGSKLHLNADDHLECPECNLVCVVHCLEYVVQRKRGRGRFRFEDSEINAGFGPLGKLADDDSGSTSRMELRLDYFKSREEIEAYVDPRIAEPLVRNSGKDLWRRFAGEFKGFLQQQGAAGMLQAWESAPIRTAFYAQRVIPAIARAMGLEPEVERERVDHALSKRVGEHLIPLIHIESENNYSSASREIGKLCLFNAPLRVLITVTPRPLERGSTSPAFSKLREWGETIQAHSQANRDYSGVTAIIVGQAIGDSMSFWACAFHPCGDLMDPLMTFASFDLGAARASIQGRA